jgi:GNAT superfamily N-acetyltransferase
MLTFVPGHQTNDIQRNRMATLLFSTSYLQYCSFANKLRLPLVELQRRQNIDQYIEHVQAMFDADQHFAGFFTAATLRQFDQLGAVSWYRDEMRDMDAAYDAFVALHARPADYFVASLAIEEHCRGAGLFNAMLEHIKAQARASGSPRIVLTVWERSDALQIYLRKGFRSCARFDYAWELFFDRLHFLEFPLEAP